MPSMPWHYHHSSQCCSHTGWLKRYGWCQHAHNCSVDTTVVSPTINPCRGSLEPPLPARPTRLLEAIAGLDELMINESKIDALIMTLTVILAESLTNDLSQKTVGIVFIPSCHPILNPTSCLWTLPPSPPKPKNKVLYKPPCTHCPYLPYCSIFYANASNGKMIHWLVWKVLNMIILYQ